MKKKILFFGGCHGSGKTTILNSVSAKYNIPLVKEFVRIEEINRFLKYSTLRQFMYVGEHIMAMREAIKIYDNFLVDRTPYDFWPYSMASGIGGDIFIRLGEEMCEWLNDEGVEIKVVFLNIPYEENKRRIERRHRSNVEWELKVLPGVYLCFETLGQRWESVKDEEGFVNICKDFFSEKMNAMVNETIKKHNLVDRKWDDDVQADR